MDRSRIEHGGVTFPFLIFPLSKFPDAVIDSDDILHLQDKRIAHDGYKFPNY